MSLKNSDIWLDASATQKEGQVGAVERVVQSSRSGRDAACCVFTRPVV